MKSSAFTLHWGDRLAALNRAYAGGDAAAFSTALRALHEDGATQSVPVLADVMKVSEDLHEALSRFRSDSRLAALAHQEIPDARLRLDHVLTLTEEAAHRTMDLVESSLPLADATVRNATALLGSLDGSSQQDVRRFVEETRGNLESVRANLSQMMLAQSYQDLTGQILRGVRRLIVEVEAALNELARLTGAKLGASSISPASLEGPAIPGVSRNAVTAQSDVDDLMAGLGI